MPSGAKACFAISAIGLFVAIRILVHDSPGWPQGADMLPRIAGTFLLPVAFLILGLYLWDRAKKTKNQ